MTDSYQLPCWAYAYGGPVGEGRIRCKPDDFIVEELPGFVLSGKGEHAFIQIEKCGENTDYVAHELAKFAGVAKRDIGFAGLKDRHARTTQWFSVWLPGKDDPDWTEFETASVKILQYVRHARKLKSGVLAGNKFELTIRDWSGDREAINRLLETIRSRGVPNYFGAQRFGIKAQNINKAMELFKGKRVKRQQKSLYLSAVRSFLFNQILSERVTQQNWDQAINGDTFMFDGSHSYFQSSCPDQDTLQRVRLGAIHPTGILWGKGEWPVNNDALEIEKQVVDRYRPLTEGLERWGVEIKRRALRVNVADLEWQFVDQETIKLGFILPPGCYATSVLRELISI